MNNFKETYISKWFYYNDIEYIISLNEESKSFAEAFEFFCKAIKDKLVLKQVNRLQSQKMNIAKQFKRSAHKTVFQQLYRNDEKFVFYVTNKYSFKDRVHSLINFLNNDVFEDCDDLTKVYELKTIKKNFEINLQDALSNFEHIDYSKVNLNIEVNVTLEPIE